MDHLANLGRLAASKDRIPLVGQVHLGVRHRCVDGGLAELLFDHTLLRLPELRLHVRAQLVQAVEAAGLDRELVVELRQALLLDLLDGDREDGGLPRHLVGAVVLGEGDLDVALVARARAGELLLEAGDEAS